jgi:hypothetical protein
VTSLLELLYFCLLFLTAFVAVLTMFASVITIAVWSVTRLTLWLTAEPETDPRKQGQMYLHRADHLKRAGQ